MMGPSRVYRLAALCGLCVYVYIWCSACLCQCDLVVSVSKKAALGGGVVASTLHKASLQRLPSKYTTKHYAQSKNKRVELEHQTRFTGHTPTLKTTPVSKYHTIFCLEN